MTAVLLRIARYKSSLELTDPDQLIDQEFRTASGDVDLSLSVYEVDDAAAPSGQVTQAQAEHSASFLRDPPRGSHSVNLAQLRGQAITTPGQTKFRFTIEAHREIVLNGRDELRALASQILNRVHPKFAVAKAEIISYAASRTHAADPEWRSILEDPDRSEWKRQVRAEVDRRSPKQ